MHSIHYFYELDYPRCLAIAMWVGCAGKRHHCVLEVMTTRLNIPTGACNLISSDRIGSMTIPHLNKWSGQALMRCLLTTSKSVSSDYTPTQLFFRRGYCIHTVLRWKQETYCASIARYHADLPTRAPLVYFCYTCLVMYRVHTSAADCNVTRFLRSLATRTNAPGNLSHCPSLFPRPSRQDSIRTFVKSKYSGRLGEVERDKHHTTLPCRPGRWIVLALALSLLLSRSY